MTHTWFLNQRKPWVYRQVACWLMEESASDPSGAHVEAVQVRLLSQLQQLLGSFSPGSRSQWYLLRACLDQQVGS